MGSEESKESHSSQTCSETGRTPQTNRHPVQDDLSNAVDYLYRNYTKCRSCTSSSDLVKVTDEQGNILVVWCQFCSHTFGVDDTISPKVLLNLYKQGHIEVNIGCCANKDPNKFKIEGFDGSGFLVRCLKCNTYDLLGDQESTGVCEDPGPDELVCFCGNRDQADMTVCMFGDEVRCVICRKCDAYVNMPRVTKTPTEFPENADIPQPSELISCECPPGEKNMTITRDENGEPEIIACSKCGLYYLPKNPMRSSPSKKRRPRKASQKPTFRQKPKFPKGHGDDSSKHHDSPTYREVQQISDLRRGDHIMWDCLLGYGHHAIVGSVHHKKGKISVWHYNGPSPHVTHKLVGQIYYEELDPFGRKLERLYLVEHRNPLPPDEVIRRAESRAGELKYNLVQNNCEHFATWCKTGKHVSAQVMSVKDCFMKYAKACTKVPIPGALGRYGAVALMAPFEIGNCVYDIYNAAEARKKGHMSRDAFVDLTVSKTCQTAGGLAGMALGMWIPIPFVGEFIGATVGGMIGQFVGKLMGGLVVKGGRELGAW